MANAKHNKKRFKGIITILILIVLVATSVVMIEKEPKVPSSGQVNQPAINQNGEPLGELLMTMIDVGQADSFLFEQNGKVAVVDCGTRSTGKNVVSYLKSKGITRIDYLIGTHPHEDHMGGMYAVLTSFDIGTVIIPKVTKSEITTNWYTKLMGELSSGKYDVKYSEVGQEYNLGQAKMKTIGPITEPDDENLNNYSIVMKVSFGDMDVIMTGDAEEQVEKEILQSGVDLDAEMLKVGHHGSQTSTSDAFLDAIDPDYALISAKVGNKYDHPMPTTMAKLKARNIEVYRTDEQGNVVITITAKEITFNCTPGDYQSGTQLAESSKKGG